MSKTFKRVSSSAGQTVLADTTDFDRKILISHSVNATGFVKGEPLQNVVKGRILTRDSVAVGSGVTNQSVELNFHGPLGNDFNALKAATLAAVDLAFDQMITGFMPNITEIVVG